MNILINMLFFFVHVHAASAAPLSHKGQVKYILSSHFDKLQFASAIFQPFLYYKMHNKVFIMYFIKTFIKVFIKYMFFFYRLIS